MSTSIVPSPSQAAGESTESSQDDSSERLIPKLISNKADAEPESPSNKREIFLPEEILAEMLSWVPTEDLIRLSTVSKQWHAVISAPNFIRSHTRNANHDPGFICQSEGEPNTLIFTNIVMNAEIAFHFRLKRDQTDQIATLHASCNGVVLLETQKRDFYVYNPIKCQSLRIPCLAQSASSERSTSIWSLAYNSSSGKFTAVCGRLGCDGYECNLLTVGSDGPWRRVAVPDNHGLRAFPPVHAGGALHWMIHSMEIESLAGEWGQPPQSMGRLLTLNVAAAEFKVVDHPPCASGVYTLLEAGGSLCFADHMNNTELKLWRLAGSSPGEEWMELCRVEVREEEEKLFEGFLTDTVPVAVVVGEGQSTTSVILKNLDYYYSYNVESGILLDLDLDVDWKEGMSWVEDKFSPFSHVNTLLTWDC